MIIQIGKGIVFSNAVMLREMDIQSKKQDKMKNKDIKTQL